MKQRSDFLDFNPDCENGSLGNNVHRHSSTKIRLQALISSPSRGSVSSISTPNWLKSFFGAGWEWESAGGGGRRLFLIDYNSSERKELSGSEALSLSVKHWVTQATQVSAWKCTPWRSCLVKEAQSVLIRVVLREAFSQEGPGDLCRCLRRCFCIYWTGAFLLWAPGHSDTTYAPTAQYKHCWLYFLHNSSWASWDSLHFTCNKRTHILQHRAKHSHIGNKGNQSGALQSMFWTIIAPSNAPKHLRVYWWSYT